MGPFGVVDAYRLGHHLACLSEVGRTLPQELVLENAIDALCQGILLAVIAVSHGAAQSMFAMDILVVGRAILDGFNRSSQHLLTGGLYGATHRAAKAGDRSRGDALTWRTIALP